MKAIVSSTAPHLKKGDLRNLMDSLDRESHDIIEQVGKKDTAKGLDELKKFFGSN